ncbi:MAG: hypothetical protein FWG43_02850, partial [Clostridiales bacterium]|nr:hypothetical protein [Clostridiales bacterium]
LISGLFSNSLLGTLNHIFGAILGGAIMALAITWVHGVLLTTIAEMGFDMAFTAQGAIGHSKFVLPLVYIVPRLFGL